MVEFYILDKSILTPYSSRYIYCFFGRWPKVVLLKKGLHSYVGLPCSASFLGIFFAFLFSLAFVLMFFICTVVFSSFARIDSLSFFLGCSDVLPSFFFCACLLFCLLACIYPHTLIVACASAHTNHEHTYQTSRTSILIVMV